MTEEDKILLLKDEYIHLQEMYEDVDKRGLTIKSWGITVCLAITGLGFKMSEYLFVISFIASIIFWYLEAFWRGINYFQAIRIKKIEKMFRDNNFSSEAPLQIYTDWVNEFNKPKPQGGSKTIKYFFKPVSYMPHLFTAIISLIFFILWLFGIDFVKTTVSNS